MARYNRVYNNNCVPEWLTIIIESIIITACQNGSLYRDYIINCVPEWLTTIITACQNGSLYRDYINNCVPEWLAV